MAFPFEIIEENEELLAINKPKGLVVNRSESVKEKTLADYTESYLKIKTPNNYSKLTRDKKEFYDKQGVVHRLDKDTTGVIVVAKTPDSYVNLKKQFVKRSVTKEYTAAVFNDITHLFENKDYVRVNLPLKRNPTNRSQFAVIESGREALSDIYLKTKFMRSNVQPVANYGGFTFTLLKVVPHTGRTHQIRVHTKALNAEILGDPLYCGRKQLGFARAEKIPLMLHARNLKILNYNLTADYPKTFEKIVKKIWRL